jgi:O-antigen ligase
MVERVRLWTAQAAWSGLVFLLPLTSVPFIVRLVGSDTVAAPSGIFLLLLLIVWLVPFLIQGGHLSRQSFPLIVLGLYAIATTALACFGVIPAYKGIDPLSSNLKALLTLGVGIGFYLTASSWPVTNKRLNWTLRLINIAGLVMIVWSLAQTSAWYMFHRYPQWMRDFQDLLSVGPLYRQRTAGFALEPSWLAHQLNMLFLPYWLAATVRRTSVHRKLLGISFENVLLILGGIVLWFTLSRVGLLAFLLTIGYVLILVNIRFAGWIQAHIANKDPREANHSRSKSRWIRAGIFLGLLLVYLAAMIGVAYGLSKVDRRMEKVFQVSFGQDALMEYANQLTFASRLVYWQAGWEIFNDQPVFGVGLGNAGFYFPQKLPAFAWKLVEVHDLVYRSGNLLNIKSIWVRLLAETGSIGFALFCSWLVMIWFTARSLMQRGDPTVQTIGLSGQFILIAFLLEGFSIDSLALPYLWMGTGIVTAAYLCGLPSVTGTKADKNFEKSAEEIDQAGI